MTNAETRSSESREPLEKLAEEFVERLRRGEAVSVEDYTVRHPKLAEEIRKLFPTLVAMEHVGDRARDTVASGERRQESQEQLRRVGEYEIVREIGRGGMGIVYEAEQPSLGRRVALKVLPAHRLGDRRHAERFEREVRAAARLRHPRIVPVYATGSDGGIPYFAMQYVPGRCLQEVLADVQKLRRDRVGDALLVNVVGPDSFPVGTSEAAVAAESTTAAGGAGEAARSESKNATTHVEDDPSTTSRRRPLYYRNVAEMVIGLTEALDYAHTEGVLHRDIKPSNILLEAGGNVWLTDFGLAKDDSSDDLTRTGEVLGTLRYLAPERLRGWCDPRSDVYSLGLTLFELVTLEAAFPGADQAGVVRAIEEREPPRPRQLDRDVPRDLETIILKAIEKAPERRYQTMRELGDDLRRFVNGEPVRARRASLWDRGAKWVRRHQGVSILLVVLLLVAAAGATASTFFVLREARRADEEFSEKNKALRRSEGLRLSARSALAKESDPGLALLLAIEGARRHPGREANAALYGALESLDELRVFTGHKKPVVHAQVSVDGRRLLTVSNGSIRLWDMASGEELRSYGYRDTMRVALAPGGESFFGVCWIVSQLREWDIASGELVSQSDPLRFRNLVHFLPRGDGTYEQRTMRSFASVGAAYFSPDARRLALVGKAGALELFDRENTKRIASPSPKKGLVAWRGSGNLLYFTDDGKLLTVDAESGSVESTVELEDLGSPTAVAAGPNGFVAAADGPDIRIFDKNGSLAGVLRGHTRAVRALAFDGDGARLISGADDTAARIWDVTRRDPLHELRGHAGAVLHVVFLSGGDRVLTTSADGTARTWEPGRWNRRHLVRDVDVPGGVERTFTWSGDNSILFEDSTSDVRFWRPGTGRPSVLLRASGQKRLCAYTGLSDRSGESVAVWGDASIALWNVAGEPKVLWHERLGPGVKTGFDFVCFSPSGDRIALGFDHNNEFVVDVRETATGSREVRFPIAGRPDGWPTIAFTPSGKRLVWGSASGRITICDISSGDAVTIPGQWMTYLEGDAPLFTPDRSRVVTVRYEDESHDRAQSILVSDSESGETREEIPMPLRGSELRFDGGVFDAEGRYLALREGDDDEGDDDTARVSLLDAQAGTWRWSVTVDSGVVGLHFMERARYLVITTVDGRAMLRAVLDSSMEEIRVGLDASAQCLSTDLEGTVLAAACDDGAVRLWDMEPRECIAVLDGHLGGAVHVEFNPTGERFITVDKDGTARVWPLDPLREAKRVRTRSLTPAELEEAPSLDRLRPTSGDHTPGPFMKDRRETP